MGVFNFLTKFTLIFFNVIFFLAGLVPLIMGIIALADEELMADVIAKAIIFIPENARQSAWDIIDAVIKNYAIVLVSIGAVIAVIGFVGCCGAIFDFKPLLKLYLFLMTLIILAEIAIIIVAVAFPEKFSEGGKTLLDSFHNVKDCTITNSTADDGQIAMRCDGDGEGSRESLESLVWHVMQYGLYCCGTNNIDDYTDGQSTWRGSSRDPRAIAPVTCCKHSGRNLPIANLTFTPTFQTDECLYVGLVRDYYNTRGCFDAMLHEAARSTVFIAVMSVTGAIELIILLATVVQLQKRSKFSRAR